MTSLQLMNSSENSGIASPKTPLPPPPPRPPPSPPPATATTSMTTSGSPSSTSNLSALDPSSLFTASIDWPGVWQAVVDSVLAFCGRLLYALALLIVGWLVVSCLVLPLVRRIVRRKHYEKTVASFIELSVGAVLKVLLVIAAIDLLGVQVLSLTAFLAAFGLGIGASLTELIQNFFAGITLVAQRPVKVGDWLEVEGTSVFAEVAAVGVTHTRMLTGQRKCVVVPNRLLTNGVVFNYNAEPEMRVDIECTIRHSEDTELVRQVFLEACACDTRVLATPKPLMRLLSLDGDGVRLSWRLWVKQEDYWPVFHEFKEQMKRQFNRYGMQFQIVRREVELTPVAQSASDDYRTARLDAHVVDRLHRLSAKWDELLDDIDAAQQRAASRAQRATFHRPLRRLRRKFVRHDDSLDSLEDETHELARIKDHAKTALHSQASDRTQEQRPSAVGSTSPRDYDRPDGPTRVQVADEIDDLSSAATSHDLLDC